MSHDEPRQSNPIHQSIVKAFLLDEPWPINDVLRKLVYASKHLLAYHSCDMHGHEEIKLAVEAAERIELNITALNVEIAQRHSRKEQAVTAPIDHAIAELLHHLARARRGREGECGHVNLAMTRPDLLDVVAHTDKLGLTEHLGIGLDWPYLRLSPKGAEAVTEAIAAMREVT